jgi:hypothetical protein
MRFSLHSRGLIAGASLTLALAACVPAPSPTPPPEQKAPSPAAPPPAEPTGDWQDRSLASGDWTYRSDQFGSAALFGTAATEAILSIRCEPSTKRILFYRLGTMTPASAQVTVRTSFGAVQWPAANDRAALPHVVVTRAAGDAALDQIAFSRGRFAFEAPGLPMLVVPAWPEVARVIEDCRE